MATVMGKSTGTTSRKFLMVAFWGLVALILIGFAVLVLLMNNGGLGGRNPTTVNVSEQNAGSKVQLHMGDKLAVTLEGNPTTGYNWEVASNDAAILKPVGEAQFKPDSSAVGAGGKVTLQFEATGTGQTPLKLVYHRPFEKDVPPLSTFELTVTVEK